MKQLITGFVITVRIISHLIGVIYYWATLALPRLLPESAEGFKEIKRIMTTYYGLKDDPTTWSAVAGQLQSPKPTTIRISYLELRNKARRVYMNAIAQDQKVIASLEINKRLEESVKRAKDDFEKEEKLTHGEGADSDLAPISPQWSHIGSAQSMPLDIQGNMQELPKPSEEMVRAFKHDGVQRY